MGFTSLGEIYVRGDVDLEQVKARYVDEFKQAFSQAIRRLSDRVEDLIFLDVPSRVAKYLLDLARAGGDGTELTLTQDELAAFIGASRVSVNRVLGDLERRDIISIKRRRIAIKDADRLGKEIRF